MQVCFKYLFSVCQSDLLHHDVHVQLLEDQPARPGRAEEAAGTLAVVPQPDAGVAALAPVLPLHADEMTCIQSFHLLYPRGHAERPGGADPRSSVPPVMPSGPGQRAPALWQAASPPSGDFGPRQDVSHRPPHVGSLPRSSEGERLRGVPKRPWRAVYYWRSPCSKKSVLRWFSPPCLLPRPLGTFMTCRSHFLRCGGCTQIHLFKNPLV